jgi:hypothetical protein
MVSDLESSNSSSDQPEPAPAGEARSAVRGWLKMGAIAAASALAGGLAVAWVYRRTLNQLREDGNSSPAPGFRPFEDDSGEDG